MSDFLTVLQKPFYMWSVCWKLYLSDSASFFQQISLLYYLNCPIVLYKHKMLPLKAMLVINQLDYWSDKTLELQNSEWRWLKVWKNAIYVLQNYIWRELLYSNKAIKVCISPLNWFHLCHVWKRIHVPRADAQRACVTFDWRTICLCHCVSCSQYDPKYRDCLAMTPGNSIICDCNISL